MEILIVALFVAGMVFLFLSGMFFSEFRFNLGLVFFIAGFVLLLSFGILVGEEAKGQPLIKISVGAYNVVSVYDEGGRVSLWTEELGDDKKKHLLFYQLLREAFEGDIKKDAKYLVVIEAGGFKKLRLQ